MLLGGLMLRWYLDTPAPITAALVLIAALFLTLYKA